MNGDQWLQHVSGLEVQPVYGQVEDDGTEAWQLYTRPGNAYAYAVRMGRRVGDKAWRRLDEQGWQLSKELGYVVDTPRLHSGQAGAVQRIN